jgi:GNAT superfamily N-acetyltransferase
MKISVAGDSDIPALTAVEIESKRMSIAQWIDPVEMDHARRLGRWQTYFAGKSPASARPSRRVWKAVTGERIVGLLAAHLTTRFDMEAEIQSMYVLWDYQRQGIGTALLRRVAEWLALQRARRLCVGIERANPYQVFYAKHGAAYLNEHWMFWDDARAIKKHPA